MVIALLRESEEIYEGTCVASDAIWFAGKESPSPTPPSTYALEGAVGSPVGPEASTSQTTQVLWEGEAQRWVPRTDFGRRLLALRQEAIRSGVRVLTRDEVLEEVRRRRGELDDEEADLR